MLPYRYAALPLSAAGKYTRLLRLSPGEFSDDLHVELDQVLLDGTTNYEALSYVWGSTAHPVSVLVGPSREHIISVTQYLAIALRHLRYAHQSRTLWVDAVCIDQSNLQERSYQVTLMSDIYRAACRVVVWLGPEEDGSFHAFNAMHIIGSNIDVNWVSCSFKPKVAADNSSSTILEEVQNYRFRDEEVNAFNRLFHRQWFERLWIRQEIGLATQAIICCGRLSMPWHLFRDAFFFIFFRGETLIQAVSKDQRSSYGIRMQLVMRVCQHGVYQLQDLRAHLGQVVCADPRDRIYGIMSLLHPSQQNMGIIPDYTRDVALIYKDATQRFINHSNGLSILVQCELQDSSLHMPTWVPNWSIDPITMPIWGTSSLASACLEPIAIFKEEDTVRVAGLTIATIQDVQTIHLGDGDDDFQTMLTALWKLIMSKSAIPNDTETSQLSAVCDALCCGAFRHSTIPFREDFPDFKSVMQTFNSRLAPEMSIFCNTNFTNEWPKYRRNVRHVCRNRSFFVTAEGSVGVAPLCARPGDIVCVILGCCSTIILRQTGDHTYQVVGQSYMPGVNTGEALLGSLPEHLRQVCYSEEQGIMHRFALWNEHTGEVQYQDPRLDKLLLNPGFQAHGHGKKYFPTIETSVEALQNAGIAAQYFDLV